MTNADWQFGVGQTGRQERAEIRRAEIEGRAEEYAVAQIAARTREQAESQPKRKRRRKNAETAEPHATTPPTRGTEPLPLPLFTPDPARWNNGLLVDHAQGRLEPVPIPIPATVVAWARPVAEFVALVIGLRLTVGDRRPSPFGSAWVAGHVGCSQPTAHRALVTLASKEIGFTVAEEPMPGRNGRKGTAVYGIPGVTQEGESDRVPVAGLQPGAVPVEAQDVGAPCPAIEPSGEAVDEARVGDAEGGDAAGPLNGVVAVEGSAEEVIADGHGRAMYARRPTPQHLLEQALTLDKAARHQAYWLAQQLRDNGYNEHSEAYETLLDFAARQPVRFNTNHATRALGHAYGQPAREPWGGA